MSLINLGWRIAMPAVATSFLFCVAAPAQVQFGELAKRHLPPDTDDTLAAALADVDLDGDPDLVCGNQAGQTRLYVNDGSGFTDATYGRIPPDSDQTLALALADVDLDGDPDLAIGNWGQNRLYINDGTGTFGG